MEEDIPSDNDDTKQLIEQQEEHRVLTSTL